MARVAFARVASEGLASVEREIVVLDIATGEERVLSGYTFGQDWQPALTGWNQAGTHLLVLWPGPDGI